MNQLGSGDRGTVLESLDGVRLQLAGGTLAEPVRPEAPPAGPGFEEELYRPRLRPGVPRLVMLDDGEQAAGEVYRLREATTVIGRSEGQVRLPHDALVSARHAEIVRGGTARPYTWLLRDLGSSNGTFVRCGRAILRPDRLVLLGGRRLRFRPAEAAGAWAGAAEPAGTTLVDAAAVRASVWPMLVETTQAAGGMELALSEAELVLGRAGCGNTLEIADPQLAPHHGRIFRDPGGQWIIEAMPSLNGIWIQVGAVELTGVCRFQVGEQRFVFMS